MPATPASQIANTAKSFFVAASHLLNYPQESPLPVLFLLARSIELALKSILIRGGTQPQVLSRKPFGHDLVALVTEVQRLQLVDPNTLTTLDISALELLNREYISTKLGYPELGRTYMLPRLDLVDEATKKLVNLARHDD